MNQLKKINAIFFAIAIFFPSIMVTANEARERSEIPEKYKWDLSSMYANKLAWKKDFDLASKRISDLEKISWDP